MENKVELDADIIPYRYDESEGNNDDDSTKRKKGFSELFKKQMGLRRVSLTRQCTKALFSRIFFVFFSSTTKETFCSVVFMSLDICLPTVPNRKVWGPLRTRSQMFMALPQP